MDSSCKSVTQCIIPGCTSITESTESTNLLFFKMSFGDLPYWWKSTTWVAKYNTELPAGALICERHFEERFIDRTRKKPRLIVGTIPTLNLASLEVDNGNNLQYFCRLCAKKGFTPMRFRLEQLNEMSDVVQCCLGRFQTEMNLPTGVCEDCINTIKKFAHFVRQCEESQMQILQLHTNRGSELDIVTARYSTVEANKENSDSKEQFETKLTDIDNESSRSCSDKTESKTFADGKPCPDCGKLFKTKARYYHHVKSHTELLQYGCQICGKNFTRRDGLRRHLEHVHGGKIKYKCMQCGEMFAYKNQLRNHHVKVHPDAVETIAAPEGSERIDEKPGTANETSSNALDHIKPPL